MTFWQGDTELYTRSDITSVPFELLISTLRLRLFVIMEEVYVPLALLIKYSYKCINMR